MNRTPPSPYLSHVPNRDITTKNGKQLTLMNPAYMLRQMMDEYSGLYGAKGHITALEILNPKSIPDKWEKNALNSFQKNHNITEIIELTGDGENEQLRLIRPMQNAPSCMKCHSHQKIYQGTKTAGGVSVTVPMKDIYKLEKESFNKTILIHILFWLFGITIFKFVYAKERKAKKQVHSLLKESIQKNIIIEKTNKELYKKQIELDKKAKDLKLSSKYKSEFLANMSHEIRTPLNAITGFINLLDKRINDEQSKEYINIIKNSNKSLLQIIEDILDFSKIESGKLIIDKINFNLHEELILSAEIFKANCLESKVSLIINSDNSLPKYINADPLRIKQVISNLLSNAIKFTEEGEVTLNINYQDNKLLISIKDNGKGIAKNKLKYIFESFNQEDNSTTRKFGGTGLGLAISKKLINLMGGEINVKSEEGVGSEFFFSIPVTTVKGKQGNNILQEQEVQGTGQNVLIVEDNKSNQLLMKIILTEMNFNVEIAEDGKKGVEAYMHGDYNLILMDENMPNMNGIEATQLIIKYEKEHHIDHTPIIALTANAVKGDRKKFLDAGMDEYLSKPVDVEKLAQTIKKVISL